MSTASWSLPEQLPRSWRANDGRKARTLSGCDIYCQVLAETPESGRVGDVRVKAMDPRPLKANICIKGVHAPAGFSHPERVSWEQAMDDISARLSAIVAKHGAASLAVSSGTTPLNEVYEFAQPVTARGLVFMDTPGYDPVSATGQVAGGANLICFTTGRGSAYGCAPTPSLKLSTNSELWRRQHDDIDLDCGGILEGAESVDACGERIFQLMLDTASGRKTRSDLHGYGQNEFVPWQLGAVM